MKYLHSLWLGLVAVAVLAPAHAAEQTGAVSSDMKILIDKVKADKKLLVAANMALTETEATGFWPIYDAYQADLAASNNRLQKTITAYATAYNAKTLTDEQASKLSAESLAIDESEATMRTQYASKLAKVLPGKKAAVYLQIEGKIRAAVRYELATHIPLVE
jgi:hypothetical protein